METSSESSPADQATDTVLTVPVVQEELRVGVRTVDTGGVRIHKTVHEHPHQIDQALLRDAVDVKRVVIDKIVALSDAPQSRQEGATLIIPVVEEVLVVEKRLRIKEEIHITRNQRTEQHSETVVLRSEEVTVERFGQVPDLAITPTSRR